jgi:hypothetical protein
MIGGLSVAKKVAEELRLQHVYCDPDPAERRALKIIDFEGREGIGRWSYSARTFVFVIDASRWRAVHQREDAQRL